MNDYESSLDKILREVREQGAFDDLPVKGKPIRWEDKSMVPDDRRLANRLLKHNNFTLDWIEMGKELDREYERARQDLEIARRRYQNGVGQPSGRGDRGTGGSGPVARGEISVSQLEKTAGKDSRPTRDEHKWNAARERFVSQVEELNRRVIGYNLRVPGDQFFRRPYPKNVD